MNESTTCLLTWLRIAFHSSEDCIHIFSAFSKTSSLEVLFIDFILNIVRVTLAAMMWHDTTNTKKSSHELKSFDDFVTTLV